MEFWKLAVSGKKTRFLTFLILFLTFITTMRKWLYSGARVVIWRLCCSSSAGVFVTDNEWHVKTAQHQDSVPRAQQTDWSTDVVGRSWTLSEIPQRLPRLQEELFPALFLHLRWRAAQHSGKQRCKLRTGTHDQGSNTNSVSDLSKEVRNWFNKNN